MPRVSRLEAEKNRGAIERASARLFRERGLRASLKQVMGAAGLTHGGFYGHFRSKDELVAAACAAAFAGSVGRWRRRAAGAANRRAARAALVEGYLAPRNRRSVGTGCPLCSLATDVAREAEDMPVRRAFREGLEGLLGILAQVQPRGTRRRRERALAQLSALVGAMLLARATSGSVLSQEILRAARRSLLAGAKAARVRPTARVRPAASVRPAARVRPAASVRPAARAPSAGARAAAKAIA